ncbi:receptor-transporting protein 4 [Talpa occidentalis]|uniref:receptor-transporting protein 4 n=1 Tax=Talpa occidentalis TaxID=50954 RepID=UPI0018908508|nr:receptor-transporting protein 4 [Talpa occidentalis]
MVLDIQVWNQTFQELMNPSTRDRWTLRLDETLQPDRLACGWRQYQQRAFGRFLCSLCRRNWCSAQVQILCHMHLKKKKSQGRVLIRFFGQKCQKCSWSQFEKPDFSQESTHRILTNLVQRVLEKFYENGIRRVAEIPVRPEVHLEGAHDTANCEACSLGICEQDNMVEPSELPFSYMEIGNYVNGSSVSSHNAGEDPRSHWKTSQQPKPGTVQQAVSREGSWPTLQITQSIFPEGAVSLGTQAAYGRQRQRRDSAGEPAPHSFSNSSPLVPPNDSSTQYLLSMLGYVCVVALFTYLAAHYN